MRGGDNDMRCIVVWDFEDEFNDLLWVLEREANVFCIKR